MRIHGLPEVTELQENDSFVVDSPSAGTRSLPKEKAKEIFGGGSGGGTGFKRIFQASAVLTADDTIEITLPLRLTGIDLADGPEDQSEESEYLLPGDVFFVSVDTGAVDSTNRIIKSIFRSNIDDVVLDYTKKQTTFPVPITSAINVSIESGEGMYGSRNTGLYLRAGNITINSVYLKRGKKLFFIMLYNGWVTLNNMPSFSDLTDGYVSPYVLTAYSNSLYYHQELHISGLKYGQSAVPIISNSITNTYVYDGGYFLIIANIYNDTSSVRGVNGSAVYIYHLRQKSSALSYAVSTSSGGTSGNIIYAVGSTGTLSAVSFSIPNSDGKLYASINASGKYLSAVSYRLGMGYAVS